MQKIGIDNLRELTSGLDGTSTKVQKWLKKLAIGTAYTILADAQENVPVDDGDLRRSLTVKKEDEDGLKYSVGSSLKYAAYQEFGTGDLTEIPSELKELAGKFKADPQKRLVNMPAQPYLYPALLHGRRFMGKQIEKFKLKDL